MALLSVPINVPVKSNLKGNATCCVYSCQSPRMMFIKATLLILAYFGCGQQRAWSQEPVVNAPKAAELPILVVDSNDTHFRDLPN